MVVSNSGRRKGTPNKNGQHARRLFAEGEDKAIADKIIRDAKAGDANARALYLRYIRPIRRVETVLKPVEYKAPESVEEARAAILMLSAQLAKGEIGLEMHDALVSDLRAYLGDKAVEQERMLAKLEADLSKDAG
jgi:hypothetical protein